MKTEGVIWFTTQEKAFGIVYGEDNYTGQRKAYIACVSGLDEQKDIEKILQYGTKVLPEQAKQLSEYLNQEES